MATVAQLLIKIGADTSELRKQLNTTKRQIRNAFGSDFIRVSNRAALAIGGIGAAIAAAGVKAIEAAGKLQNVQTAFTNMLGSAQKSAAFTKDEMLQLTEAGIPAWQMLADKIGKSVPEVMDMVSKGAVDAATGINALVEGMNKKFGGMMEQQSHTIQGTWSTLMDGIDQAAAQVGLKLAEYFNVTDIFQSLGNVLNNFAQTVQSDGLLAAFQTAIPTEFQAALVGVATVLVGVAVPAISLAITSLIAFAAPLIAAVSAAAPFIAAAGAIATALYVLWERGTTVADILDFFGIHLELVNIVIDTAKSHFEQLGRTIQAVFTLAQPLITTFGIVAAVVFKFLALIVGMLAQGLMIFGTIFTYVFDLALKVIEWAANGIGGFLSYIGDRFMENSNNLLPEWATNAMKTISNFVSTAIGWLNNLIAKIFETNAALGKAGEKKSPQAAKAPKKLEIPKYEQFKNAAPVKDVKTPKIKATKTTDPLLNEAKNTSKQIAKEWYRTFSTKSALVDRWYKEESDSLEKTRALNTNYEVDKQRLTELYAQKRLDALRAEAKDRDDIIKSARELSMNNKESSLSLYNKDSAKQLEEMKLDYEKALNSIADRWAEQQRNFAGMTKEQKNTYLAALKEYGVAYELNAKQEISFKEEAEKEKLAAYKKYQDEALDYYRQCKDIQADIDKAYATSSYSALKNTLNKENLARLSAYNSAQGTMKAYYDATVEAHESFQQRLTDAITNSQNSFQEFFTDVLTMQTTFADGMLDLFDNLFKNIVEQITAGWAASITQGALGFLMPGNGGSGNGSGGDGDQMAAFGTALDTATGSVNGLTAGVGGANGVISAGTGLMGAYNGVQSLITGTTKPAEGAATTAVTAALTALSAAATSASLALSAMSASGGFGFGLFAKGGVVKAAGGGSIVGAGTGTSDSIPAMLSNGEYVLTAAAVDKLGVPFLNKLNAGDFPGYAKGGIVRPNLFAAGKAAKGSGDGGKEEGKVINMNLNISTMDAQSFDDALARGFLERIKQALADDARIFNSEFGTF